MAGNITAVQTGSGWDVDQTGAAFLKGDLQADGSITLDAQGRSAVAAALGGAVLGETTGTEAGIRAAAAAVSLMGGGIVQLQAKTYTITSTLPLISGVVYRGAGYTLAGYGDRMRVARQRSTDRERRAGSLIRQCGRRRKNPPEAQQFVPAARAASGASGFW